MKKTLSTIATAFLMIVSLSSFAAAINPLKDKDSKSIMTTYVEAIVSGTDQFNKFLFAKDFEYKNTSNKSKYNRSQYLQHLKVTKGLKFDCETDYQILDETGNSCVAKAIMKFDNFTRVDFITLNKTEDGWKISKVETTYP